MLKYKILNKKTDSFIKLPINLDFNFMDNSEIIEEFIREEKRKSTNIQKDLEVTRFLPKTSISLIINNFLFNVGDDFRPLLDVWFYNTTATGIFPDFNYTHDYKGNGFNTDGSLDDDRLKKGFSNSFYLLDFFDVIKSTEQNKLFSVIIPTVPPVSVNKKTIVSGFFINKDTDGYYLYYLKDKSLLPKDVFMKLTFFNGKTGKITSFFNSIRANIQGIGNSQLMKNSLPTSEEYNDEMLYFKYKLDNNYSYDIIDSSSSVVVPKLVKTINAVEVRFKN